MIVPGSRQWTVSVVISRCCRYQKGNETGPIEHTDLVLLNEQGSHMYAEIGLHHVNRFKSLIEKGRVYNLRKFIITPPKIAFNPVQPAFMIWFTKHTVVQKKN